MNNDDGGAGEPKGDKDKTTQPSASPSPLWWESSPPPGWQPAPPPDGELTPPRSWIPAPSEPPGPVDVTAADIAVQVAKLAGVIALDTATHGAFSAISSLPLPRGKEERFIYGEEGEWPLVIPPDLHTTAPPERSASGEVKCTACRSLVAFSTIVINEHGYFCADCGPMQPAAEPDPADLWR